MIGMMNYLIVETTYFRTGTFQNKGISIDEFLSPFEISQNRPDVLIRLKESEFGP